MVKNITSDYFNKNTSYRYKISLIYDGYQEGPLSENDWTFEDTVTRDKLRVTIKVLKHSKRLTAVCLYRKDSVNNFYKLVREMPTNIGWAKSENNVYTRIIEDDGTLELTAEQITSIQNNLDIRDDGALTQDEVDVIAARIVSPGTKP